MEYHFYLKETLTDEPWLLRLEYLAEIFLKKKEPS
jgi:hypothetical protein